jgi:hypothetical protein
MPGFVKYLPPVYGPMVERLSKPLREFKAGVMGGVCHALEPAVDAFWGVYSRADWTYRSLG